MTSLSFYDLPPALDAELDELERLASAFRAGGVSAAEFRSHRVPFGVYEQRKDGTYMARVRCTAGGITPAGLERIAGLARVHGDGRVHFTTRQELQIHGVGPDGIIPVLRALRLSGLSTRGGGGNTVRNITASPDSGVNGEGRFDITPYAVALSSRLIAEPDSWTLPRKFKIAFADREPDEIQARFNDLAFIALIQDGRPGFRVLAGGGLGSHPRTGVELHPFILADHVYAVAEAVKRLFSKHGNRRNKHAARLRFLLNGLGEARFRELYRMELADLLANPASLLTIPPWPEVRPQPGVTGDAGPRSPAEAAWRKRYVEAQPTAGLYRVLVPVFLGMARAETLLPFARFLTGLGEDILRLTADQNLLLRNIPADRLSEVYEAAKAFTELADLPVWFGRWTCCAGADTCRLGLCRPRPLLTELKERLVRTDLDLEPLSDVVLNVSGCPNSCGKHAVADLGLCGKAARARGVLYPAYSLFTGAVRSGDDASLGVGIGEIAARALPDFLEQYLRERDTLAHPVDKRALEGILTEKASHFAETLPLFDRDFGESEPFSLKGRGPGECSAGVFDLIELDLARAREIRRLLSAEVRPEPEAVPALFREMLVSTCRALLITRGVDVRDEETIFGAFLEKFVATGLVDGAFEGLVLKARNRAEAPVCGQLTRGYELLDAVVALYQSMDDTLMFKAPQPAAQTPADPAPLLSDLRGVTCPMNFVKAKLALAPLQAGTRLRIWLDDGAPIANVPRSLADEGHQILQRSKVENYWELVVRKGGAG